MEYRAFGTTGIEVPVVGMGTWQTFDVSGKTPEEQRRRLTDTAFRAGAILFDSSPMYGEAERVLALTLERRRRQAIVATKVWTADDAEAERQVARSLELFGGSVDVYQVHNLVSSERRLDQLERLKSEGAVRVIGLTHYSPRAFGDLRRLMRDTRVGAIQIPYNPLEREVQTEILPAAADLGLGVIVMRPLGQGPLVRKSVSPSELAPLAPFGITSWSQALLKWILSDRRCHVVIPATSQPEHLLMNAAAGAPPWLGPEERAYVARLAR